MLFISFLWTFSLSVHYMFPCILTSLSHPSILIFMPFFHSFSCFFCFLRFYSFPLLMKAIFNSLFFFLFADFFIIYLFVLFLTLYLLYYLFFYWWLVYESFTSNIFLCEIIVFDSNVYFCVHIFLLPVFLCFHSFI